MTQTLPMTSTPTTGGGGRGPPKLSLTNNDPQNEQDKYDLHKDENQRLEGVGLEEKDEDLEGTVGVAALEESGRVGLGAVSSVPRDMSPDLKVVNGNTITCQERLDPCINDRYI